MKYFKHLSKKIAAIILLAMTCGWANAQKILPENIQYWVGNGSNQAIMIVNWCSDDENGAALAWGYRFDGTPTIIDMLLDINAADNRLAIYGGDCVSPINAGTPWLGGFRYDDEQYTLNSYECGWLLYLVNDEMASGTNQQIQDGDYVEFGDTECMVGWSGWELPVTPVSNPNSATEIFYDITASAGTGSPYGGIYGAISPSGTTSVAENGSITYTFTPIAGYHIGSVTVGSTDVTNLVINNAFTIENVVSDSTINVLFAVDKNNTITASDILFWVGEGDNEAILAVNWCEPETAFAWGYRFNGNDVTVQDVLDAISAADTQFNYAEAGGLLSDINYSYGCDVYNISPDFPMYNVNEEPVWFGINEQTVQNGDIIEFGGYNCALEDDFWNYVWTTEITSASVPAGIISPQSDNVKITLFPNPARATTMLSVNGLSGNIVLNIVDINGKEIYFDNFNINNSVKKIDVSNFSKGIYFVKLQNGNITKTQKLIVY